MMMAGAVMDTQKRLNENISALADGELASSEIELAFAALGTAEGQAAWEAYHRIGHALRSDSCGSELSGDSLARLATRLAAEHPSGRGSGGRSAGTRAGTSDAATSMP